MHTMTTTTSPIRTYADAGRRLSVPIFTVPVHTPKIIHVDPTNLHTALDVQIISPAQDIFTVPVHTPKIVHIEPANLHTALEAQIVTPTQDISTIPTHTPKIVHIDPANLPLALDVQIVTPTQDAPVAISPMSENMLESIETMNRPKDPAIQRAWKIVKLAILGRLGTHSGHNSNQLTESRAPSLKRRKNVKKLVGPEQRKRRPAGRGRSPPLVG